DAKRKGEKDDRCEARTLSHHPDAVAHVCWKTVHKSGTTCGIFHAISADTLIHWKDMARTERFAAKSAICVHGRTVGVRFRTLLFGTWICTRSPAILCKRHERNLPKM